MIVFVMIVVMLRNPCNFRLDFHCCPVGRKQILLWPRFVVVSNEFSTSMIVNFNVCGLLYFHEGNLSVDCNDKMLTILSLL